MSERVYSLVQLGPFPSVAPQMSVIGSYKTKKEAEDKAKTTISQPAYFGYEIHVCESVGFYSQPKPPVEFKEFE